MRPVRVTNGGAAIVGFPSEWPMCDYRAYGWAFLGLATRSQIRKRG
jgi:hypothetical protein